MAYSRFALNALGRMQEEIVIDALGRHAKPGHGKLFVMPRRKTKRGTRKQPGTVIAWPERRR